MQSYEGSGFEIIMSLMQRFFSFKEKPQEMPLIDVKDEQLLETDI